MSEYSEYAWDELLAYAQPGETFTQDDPKDEAVLTARHLNALRAVENEAAFAVNATEGADATEGTDANGSPVSDFANGEAPADTPTRKRT